MKRPWIWALMSTLVACGGEELAMTTGTAAVIGGASSPDALGVPLSTLEQNAVVGQLYNELGQKYQGCTGTLVGDRVVIAAGHCVVMNQSGWLTSGATPIVATPSNLEYVVGENVHKPLCTLKVASVHLHPDITKIPLGGIRHDVSISILNDSVVKTCHVVPAQINTETLGADFVGKQVLQGGFGSTDGTFNFSPVRHWSLMQVKEKDDDFVVVTNMKHGFPTYGDSGAGGLYRFPDGSLRNIGVVSAGDDTSMLLVRLDRETMFFDSVLDTDVVCGTVAGNGACNKDTLLTCDAKGFRSTDCTESNRTCLVQSGKAACVCTCDTKPYCEAGCACDAQCPCTCDTGEGCNEGCTCDPDCQATPDESAGGCSVSSAGGAAAGPLMLFLVLLLLPPRRRRIPSR